MKNNTLETLYNKLSIYPKISVFIVMRYLKRDYEYCLDVYEEFLDRRLKDGIEVKRKKWERIK